MPRFVATIESTFRTDANYVPKGDYEGRIYTTVADMGMKARNLKHAERTALEGYILGGAIAVRLLGVRPAKDIVSG